MLVFWNVGFLFWNELKKVGQSITPLNGCGDGGNSDCANSMGWELVDRGQTRKICEKQENYFKGKVVTFTVQSLLPY